jgi:hypothetical protein
MKKILTCLLAVLGLNSACGQENFGNADVTEFAELAADTNVVVQEAVYSNQAEGKKTNP